MNNKPIVVMTRQEKELTGVIHNIIMQYAQTHGLCLTSVLGVLALLQRTVQDQMLAVMAREFAKEAAKGIQIARPGEMPGPAPRG